MALVRSIALSMLASLLATALARRLLSVSQPPGEGGSRGSSRGQAIIVVMPILVGNSNNRMGWVKEVHHHHHPLFGRSGS
jgi:hypothetical protein